MTGAGGFIGTATLATLRESGFDVASHLGPSQFDICDVDAVRAFIAGCDAVVHLAGPPSVAASLHDPVEFVRAHALGTATVVEAMRSVHVDSLVYISSADVYGSPGATPVKETHPAAPRSPYAAAKVAAEQIVHAAASFQRLNGYVIRPFSVYGPAMMETSLVATILQQARHQTDIIVRDLRPIRDYCYVADLTDLVRCALLTPRRDVLTVNAAYGRGYSVGQVIAEISAALGRPLSAKQDGPRRSPDVEIPCLIADVATAKSALRWKARYDLRDGIRAMSGVTVQ